MVKNALVSDTDDARAMADVIGRGATGALRRDTALANERGAAVAITCCVVSDGAEVPTLMAGFGVSEVPGCGAAPAAGVTGLPAEPTDCAAGRVAGATDSLTGCATGATDWVTV